MSEEEVKSLKDLHFTITEKMKDMAISMLFAKQMLDECDLTPKDRKLLEKHLKKTIKTFAHELQTLNPVQIQIVRTFLSGKKEIDK